VNWEGAWKRTRSRVKNRGGRRRNGDFLANGRIDEGKNSSLQGGTENWSERAQEHGTVSYLTKHHSKRVKGGSCSKLGVTTKFPLSDFQEAQIGPISWRKRQGLGGKNEGIPIKK